MKPWPISTSLRPFIRPTPLQTPPCPYPTYRIHHPCVLPTTGVHHRWAVCPLIRYMVRAHGTQRQRRIHRRPERTHSCLGNRLLGDLTTIVFPIFSTTLPKFLSEQDTIMTVAYSWGLCTFLLKPGLLPIYSNSYIKRIPCRPGLYQIHWTFHHFSADSTRSACDVSCACHCSISEALKDADLFIRRSLRSDPAQSQS